MPVLVKDVEWRDSESSVVLNVPLKGASKKSIDIFSTHNYIKVSYPPYLYEVALFEEIDVDSSKATICEGEVVFHLHKVNPHKWSQLQSNASKDKQSMNKIRAEALAWRQEREAKRYKEKSDEKDARKKFSVQQQIQLDSEERDLRTSLKNMQTENISRDMEQWKKNQQKDNYLRGRTSEENNKKSIKYNQIEPTNSQQTIQTPVNSVDSQKSSSNHPDVQQEDSSEFEAVKKTLPPPRSSANIEVSFTERKLVTPARESKQAEEELWLKKVAQMNKFREDKLKDVENMDDMNPIWLKDKGNKFFKQGNYVAAINAYTTALILDSKIPMVYANRAACHLSLKQYNECIQDCTNALELYDPPVAANAPSRCRALARRGAAYCEIQEHVHALRDYEAAMKLDPNNDSLKSDAFRIRRTVQGGESTD